MKKKHKALKDANGHMVLFEETSSATITIRDPWDKLESGVNGKVEIISLAFVQYRLLQMKTYFKGLQVAIRQAVYIAKDFYYDVLYGRGELDERNER